MKQRIGGVREYKRLCDERLIEVKLAIWMGESPSHLVDLSKVEYLATARQDKDSPASL